MVMKYKVEFQYKAEDWDRPDDCVQDDEIIFENGESIPIPNVGDSVTCSWGGNRRPFKVISRHYSYLRDWCIVNIVVTDLLVEEMAARLKS